MILDLIDDTLQNHQALLNGSRAASAHVDVYARAETAYQKASPVALAGLGQLPRIGSADLRPAGHTWQRHALQSGGPYACSSAAT